MTLWQKIKLGIGGAVGVLIGVLGFALQHRTHQRDKERAERLKADNARAMEQQRREDEKRIERAMAEQRDANDIYENENRGRRTGNFGSADRLRDDT